MASHIVHYCLLMLLAMLTISSHATTLSPNFYNQVCPQALPIVKSIVQRAILRERRMGASLLRLFFHDCFVNGCDGSVLLDDTPNLIGEKTALPNIGSIRGFDVVDQIKAAVDRACKSPVVSCADILAIAARDSVAILGGQLYWYKVLLGRRDARTASKDAVVSNLPAPFSSFSELLSKFQSHGLDLKDLVALSGAHTIGFAKCTTFRDRIYNDTNIDRKFASSLKGTCPRTGGFNNLAALDRATPITFDTSYYTALLRKRGLLHSDQELYKGDGSESDKLVQQYSRNSFYFAAHFKASMIKMGNMKPKPLTGNAGEIRTNCRKVNG
ncbi:peroxidase RIP1-like [Lotus japonicus]|uniref:peroxidase RIP1-like n=1 Tax=Lotus japonicus TaxID=34305 RepID=UPI0025889936|nr:peroxidase RIP1-like [Lotus japonicus]